ncbi:MAG: zinc ABC transporter substrate-binding protein [Alistipes sp.]|nr:zinc ABC transporter substrate-binding protein [Alistipes sp.]
MRKILYLFIYIALAMMLYSCNNIEKKSYDNTIFVSIAPLKPIVEAIVGDDFSVEVLVPAGASPETFEPTPKQFIALNESVMVLSTGLLDFEKSILQRVHDQSKVINLSQGIATIAGSCSHTHHGKHCHHGVDPHIWCSPKCIDIMAKNTYNAIVAMVPDKDYSTAYSTLNEQIKELDSVVTKLCNNSSLPYFIIYHPALTYLARDYNLEQVAIEHEGKDPSAKHLATIIERARRDGMKRVFYQSEFPESSVAIVAEDIGAETVEINPLDENIFENIVTIATLITE